MHTSRLKTALSGRVDSSKSCTYPSLALSLSAWWQQRVAVRAESWRHWTQSADTVTVAQNDTRKRKKSLTRIETVQRTWSWTCLSPSRPTRTDNSVFLGENYKDRQAHAPNNSHCLVYTGLYSHWSISVVTGLQSLVYVSRHWSILSLAYISHHCSILSLVHISRLWSISVVTGLYCHWSISFVTGL